MSDKLKESMNQLQQEAQSLLVHAAYHRSLERFHKAEAEDFESRVDSQAKKIRNLESQLPKEKNHESKQEGDSTHGPMGDEKIEG